MGRLKSSQLSKCHIYLLTMMMKSLLPFPLLMMGVTSVYINCPPKTAAIACRLGQCTVTCPTTGDQKVLTCRENMVKLIPFNGGADIQCGYPACYPLCNNSLG